jgi:hypothetical protein
MTPAQDALSVILYPLVFLAVGYGLWKWISWTPGQGTKVKRYKIVSGRRVRDYDAERELTERTRPPVTTRRTREQARKAREWRHLPPAQPRQDDAQHDET